MSLLWEIAGWRTGFLDEVFLLISAAASEKVILAVLCSIYWNTGRKNALRLACSYFLSGALVQGIKVIAAVPRPWVRDPLFKPVERALSGATGYSFPSGHTQAAFSVYGTLAFQTARKAVRLALVAFACLCAFSRMYLGVHTLADVLVSAAVTVCACAAVRLMPEEWFAPPVPKAAMLFLGLSVALGVIAVLAPVGTASPADALKVAGAGVGFAAGLVLSSRRLSTSPKPGPVKFALVSAAGLAVTVALEAASKTILPAGGLWQAFGYSVVVFWIIGVYPEVIERLPRRV